MIQTAINTHTPTNTAAAFLFETFVVTINMKNLRSADCGELNTVAFYAAGIPHRTIPEIYSRQTYDLEYRTGGAKCI